MLPITIPNIDPGVGRLVFLNGSFPESFHSETVDFPGLVFHLGTAPAIKGGCLEKNTVVLILQYWIVIIHMYIYIINIFFWQTAHGNDLSLRQLAC